VVWLALRRTIDWLPFVLWLPIVTWVPYVFTFYRIIHEKILGFVKAMLTGLKAHCTPLRSRLWLLRTVKVGVSVKWLDWVFASRGRDNKTVPIVRDVRRTLWPESLDLSKPEVDLPTEETVVAVFSGPQLVGETPLRE